MKVIEEILKFVMRVLGPFSVLIYIFAFIGVIWLAFLGKWGLIFGGVIYIFISYLILQMIIMLNFPSYIAVYFYNKKFNFLGYLFGLMSYVYINLLVVSTVVIAFIICSSSYSLSIITPDTKLYVTTFSNVIKDFNTGDFKIDARITYIPYLLWSSFMGLFPWLIFLAKGDDNELADINIYTAFFLYSLFLISIFINLYFAVIMFGIFLVIQLIIIPIIFSTYAHNMIKVENEKKVV